jgi:hypothetical protein
VERVDKAAVVDRRHLDRFSLFVHAPDADP